MWDTWPPTRPRILSPATKEPGGLMFSTPWVTMPLDCRPSNMPLKTGIHPAETTKKTTATFRRQLNSLGCSFDWNREISTCDPNFYKWTQFIFLKLHERGLAYQKEVAVNWCPALKTVLANEEVVDGKSERGGHPWNDGP